MPYTIVKTEAPMSMQDVSLVGIGPQYMVLYRGMKQYASRMMEDGDEAYTLYEKLVKGLIRGVNESEMAKWLQ